MNNLTMSNHNIVDYVDTTDIKMSIDNIRKFQAVVKQTLKAEHDFGKIPGAGNKPVLLKPGAEKILMLLGVTSEYIFLECEKDYKNNFFAFTIKCILSRGGQKITEGIGHCNSMESKFRWRWVTEKDVPSGLSLDDLTSKTYNGQYGPYKKYRIENDDIHSIVNTIMKMAKKRSQIDATLTVGSLSDVFSQDFEDEEVEIQSEIKESNDKSNGIDMIVSFGEHKGKTLSQIAEINIDYIKYLSEKAHDMDLKNAASRLYLQKTKDDIPF